MAAGGELGGRALLIRTRGVPGDAVSGLVLQGAGAARQTELSGWMEDEGYIKSANDELAHVVPEHEVRQVAQHDAADYAPADAADSTDYLRSQQAFDRLARVHYILAHYFSFLQIRSVLSAQARMGTYWGLHGHSHSSVYLQCAAVIFQSTS